MKKALLFIAPLALLLSTYAALPAASSADENSNRQAALKTLAAHKKSEKRFSKATLSDSFMQNLAEQSACLDSIVSGIETSALSDEEKFGLGFATILLFIFDYQFIAAKDKAALLDKEAVRLKKAGKSIASGSANRQGRAIAYSLQGHKRALKAWAAAQGEGINFCTIRDKIEASGGYTSANFEQALAETLPGTWVETLGSDSWDKRIERAERIVSKGQKRMKKVRPKIKAKRIEQYAVLPSSSLGESMDASKYSLPLADTREINSLPSSELLEKASSLLP